ncbi:type II toxin-antitoxin system death-on-curing family toxin [Longimicrobium sp.]|uniref:type II toxin-antitoxin system death-on-curing family toxin n=1 Tax=Longimicrobium sp. TaxID=2029185 RepID=UPI003B3AF82E
MNFAESAPEPRWLGRRLVDYIQQNQIVLFGGAYGVRDSGLIESALMRPRNKWDFADEHDLCSLAAAYGYGLATNHGYVDGNKRVAFVAMTTFLELNGLLFDALEPEVVRFMVGVAAGENAEDSIAEWLRRWTEPLIG